MGGTRLAGVIAVVAALASSQANAALVFKLRIQSGAYDSGLISGAIDPDGLSGSIDLTKLAVPGAGGDFFSIGKIAGSFDLSSGALLRLAGFDVLHNSDQGGTIKFILTLSGLEDPGEALNIRNLFGGNFASLTAGTKAENKVFIDDKPMGTGQLLFQNGPMRSGSLGPNCTAPASDMFDCDALEVLPHSPFDPYSITQRIQLNFASNTSGKSEDFENSVLINRTIPEPAPWTIMGLGVLSGLLWRRRTSPTGSRQLPL